MQSVHTLLRRFFTFLTSKSTTGMADIVTKSAMPVVGLSAGAILIYPDNNTPTDLNTEK